MGYIDLLDSSRTAHPFSENLQWWRPASRKDQEESIEIARAELIIRLLHGDTIVLSDNQSIDSVAWLRLAKQICNLNLPWEPIRLAAYYSKRPTSHEALMDIAFQYFSDSKFLSSAWTGLNDDAREVILNNLTKVGNQSFSNMLDGTRRMIDSSLGNDFEIQAQGLQELYSYLEQNKTMNVNIPAIQVGEYIWPRIGKLVRNGDLDEDSINTLQQQVGPTRLEYRGDLYNALADQNKPEQDRIRKYIDRYYNEKLGLSVSSGRGVFSIEDKNVETPPDEDEKIDMIADSVNSNIGLLTKEVLRYQPGYSSDRLKWEDFEYLLGDREFQNSALYLRGMIAEYNTLNKLHPDFHKDYRTWLLRTYEALNKHQDLLASKLPNKLFRVGKAFIVLVGIGGSAILGEKLGAAVKDYIVLSGTTWSAIGSAVGIGLSEIITEKLPDALKEKLIPPVIKTVVAGRLRTDLRTSVDIRSDEELLQ